MAARLAVAMYNSSGRFHSYVSHTIYRFFLQDGYSLVAYAVFIGGFFLLDKRSLRDLYYVCIPIAIFYIVRSSQFLQLIKTPLFILVSLWLTYLCLSGLWTEHIDLQSVAESMRRSILILLFLAWTASLRSSQREFFKWLLWPVVAAASMGCLITLFHHFQGSFPFSERLVFFWQNNDVIYGATLYGVAGIITFIGILDSKFYWKHMLCGLSFFIIMISVYLTRSRGEILALIFSICMAAAMGRRRVIMTAMTIVLPSSIIILLMLDAGILEMAWRADSYRLEIWRNALEIIEHRPIFGYGIGHGLTFGQFEGDVMLDPHNIFLANHVYGGVLASLMLIGIYAMAASAGLWEIRTSRSPLIEALVLFSMLTGLFHYGNLIMNASPIWMFFWLPVGLAIATQMDIRKSQATEDVLLPGRSSRGTAT